MKDEKENQNSGTGILPVKHIPTPPRDRMIHRAHAVTREVEGIRGTFHVLANGESKPKHTHD